MKRWNDKPYHSLDYMLRERYGEKVYRVALNGGMSCPNRDGTLGYGGCIFCSEGGSGDFAESRTLGVTEQIESGKEKVKNKIKSGKYIAYFQAFTNTYADVNTLEKIFSEAINHPNIVALSVATRPDCLEQEKVELLSRLNKIKPIFVELGLQTVNEKTAKYIRRGYTLDVYDDAVERLHEQGIIVVTHIIIGLPYETKEDMLSSVKYVCKVTDGIKLQLLHILKGTDLAKDYFEHKFDVLSLEEYTDIIVECVKIIPENVVIHRLTGDGAKKDLIAPLWSADKKKVLNTINKRLSEI